MEDMYGRILKSLSLLNMLVSGKNTSVYYVFGIIWENLLCLIMLRCLLFTELLLPVL